MMNKMIYLHKSISRELIQNIRIELQKENNKKPSDENASRFYGGYTLI